MINIGILTCNKSNQVCTGASCLAAFNGKKKSFQVYKEELVQLVAFMDCNGCECDYDTDKGYREKLMRLKQIGVEVMHVGICTQNRDKKECHHITKIIDMLEEQDIKVVRGTH